MKKLDWKDTTSYSRGEYERSGGREPREFTLGVVGIGRLVVHRYHGLEGWFWSLHGPEMNIARQQLGSESAEHAKMEALYELKARIERMATAMKEIKLERAR